MKTSHKQLYAHGRLHVKIEQRMNKVPRSQLTKARILEAARTTFANLGYERTTVRNVAQRAEIHSSLVMRYFGSKENLFLASVQFDLRLPDLRRVPSGQRGERLVRHFVETWGQGNTAVQLPALLRIALSHPNGTAHLETMFREQLEPMLRNICPTEQASSRAALIVTQTLGLALARYVLRLSSVVALSEDELVRNVGRTLQAYLS